ncbi:MAG: transposase [Bacteroidales bacterium]|nr:transposase [Bacteroidales bacterium]MBP5693364.1 transposase [Bacteroidales bacterium]
MEKKYWLLSTEHLKDRLWFRDEEDFKAGMNYVAILSAIIPNVEILAFILMSNHVHFVLAGSENTANQFITRFKKLYSQYFRQKYSTKELLRSNQTDIRPVLLENDGLERAIAYVQMNSVAANICLTPSGYLWGTGGTFYTNSPEKGKKVSDMSHRECMRLTHSKAFLPKSFLFNDKGYIVPSSYVNVKFVEHVFKTPNRMNYFQNISSKAKLVRETPAFKDQLLFSAMLSLITSLFKKNRFEDLDIEQQAEVLRQLRYRFSSEPNQLARVTGFSYEEVCERLERL